jgi:dTDP-4-amino-4,6-dideoxygalactose transaminase
MIKLFEPHVSEEESNAAKEVILSHNWASGAGLGKVKEFEDRFNSFIGSKEVVSVNSGTAALHLALGSSDIKGGTVLLPSLSFVSTAHAVLYNNARPIFVDINPDTLCMDIRDLESKLDSKCVAIVPVHFGGMSCEMDRLLKISMDNKVKLIDDAAHICGGKYNGKRIGCIGDMTCFSFHPVKNLAMPTGGAISINMENSKNIKTKLNSSRWCGISNRVGNSYDVTSISPNYYMNEVSAAIGLVQLSKLDIINKKKQLIAKRYTNEINMDFKMPYLDGCVYHLYWVLSDNRDKLMKYLFAKGIEVGTHYRPIHTMTAYKEYNASRVPETEEIGNKIITIPIHPNLTDEEITYIIESINAF